MMATVNPQGLKDARENKGWTQVQLSEATKPKINISTISRLERGKPKRIRETTLRELARALGVNPSDLSQQPRSERDLMKLRVAASARNSLQLVSQRYRVRREHIVEIAPLLFFIAAERCLKERQNRLAEFKQAANSLFDLQRQFSHLPPHWPVDDGALASEESSIKARDLFGFLVAEDSDSFLRDYEPEHDPAEKNPFVAYLRKLLATVSDSADELESVRWMPSLWPSYEICADEAAALVGNDATATQAILEGAAALHDMPKGSPAERAAWAQSEYDRKYRDFDELSAPTTTGKGAPS